MISADAVTCPPTAIRRVDVSPPGTLSRAAGSGPCSPYLVPKHHVVADPKPLRGAYCGPIVEAPAPKNAHGRRHELCGGHHRVPGYHHVVCGDQSVVDFAVDMARLGASRMSPRYQAELEAALSSIRPYRAPNASVRAALKRMSSAERAANRIRAEHGKPAAADPRRVTRERVHIARCAEPQPIPKPDKPTCPRCGRSFRKSGVGLAWHIENNRNCAEKRSA